MEDTKQSGGFFRTMYKNRVKITRGDTPILNLSILFSIIALLTAPWLVIGGVLVALVMGYRLSLDTSGVGFENSFEEVVEAGKQNVKRVFKHDEE
ncbi:MAG TPA: DUF4342 domain-containing protein [Candidatus Limiplasma sp.]|nr:DUF4342 domain-containing protein [Candidatus Limiplasma sp.]HRX07937.1 DUF4342 domain-containing protein [Candidatus Limiplasma sp.]